MFNSKIFKRRLIVCHRKQLPFLFGLSIMAVVNTALALFVLAWLFVFGMDDRIAMQMDNTVVYKVLAVLAFSTIVAAVWSLTSTRNAIGLLDKITCVLRKTLAGEAPEACELNFRKKDKDYKDLEENLRQVVDRLAQAEMSPHQVVASLDKLEEDLLRNELTNEEAAVCAREIRKMVVEGESR